MHLAERRVDKCDHFVFQHQIPVTDLFHQGFVFVLRLFQLGRSGSDILFQPVCVFLKIGLMHFLEMIGKPVNGIGQAGIHLFDVAAQTCFGGFLHQHRDNEYSEKLERLLHIIQGNPDSNRILVMSLMNRLMAV